MFVAATNWPQPQSSTRGAVSRAAGGLASGLVGEVRLTATLPAGGRAAGLVGVRYRAGTGLDPAQDPVALVQRPLAAAGMGNAPDLRALPATRASAQVA